MKHFYLLLLFEIVSCHSTSIEEKLDTTPIISKDSLKEPYNFLVLKFKRVNNDSTISKARYGKDYRPWRDLFDVFALKRGDSILIVHQCVGCMFTNNTFLITLHNGNYSCALEEQSCTYSVDFIPNQQKLILKDSSYQVGDTIVGRIEYIGRYSTDSLSRFYEEASIQGNFKTVLRDSVYDYRNDRMNRLQVLEKDTAEFRRRIIQLNLEPQP